jgi:hypothetical protein
MAISSVSSNISSQVSNIKQSVPPPASSEVRGEKENDGDSDDGASSKINAPAPTVNTHGQTVGTTINVTA